MPKNMRHVVKVMRPAAPQGESTPVDPTLLRDKVPCSIEPLTGRELERMQQMAAVATHKVGMYGNPDKRIKRVDYLIDQTKARLNVLDIKDDSRAQLGYIELICGEEPA